MPTRPGIHPEFEFSKYSIADRRVIARFARHFYITRSLDPIPVGNSLYTALLMRPADHVSLVLNVDRELVVVLAEYETFEIRTLKAYDEVFARFDIQESNRIDKSMRFLVSKDASISDKIRHYLQQDPEYPIIVPYLYEDFSGVSDDFVVENVRRHFLVRDLFGYQSPLRHEYYFFGRDDLINHVVDVHRSGQNAGLFGLRKSGKTSTIYAVQRRAKALGCRTTQIDCQNPSVHARRWYELLIYITKEIRAALSLRASPDPTSMDAPAVADWFRDTMRRTLSEARANFLLIFDEIENISPKTAASDHWRAGKDSVYFWQTLRSFFQSDSRYKLTFCFVGTNPHLFEEPKIGEIDNPVYLFAPKTFIAPFGFDDARQMCERLGYFMGLDFGAEVVTELHSRFGGHPFFMRQTCSKIHQIAGLRRPLGVSVRLVRQAEADEVASLQVYIEEILAGLKNFYPDEFDMLLYLARGDAATFDQIADLYPSTVEHLVGYGIIVKKGADFDFSMNFIRDFLIKRFPLPGENILQQRRDEISRRRNKLEEEVRVRLFYWAQGLDADAWYEACAACVPKRVNSNAAPSFRDLFSKHKSPLMLLEEMKFVERADFFASRPGFQSTINSAFDVVNRLRPDAHAKDIDDAAFDAWRRSMSFLEDQFLPP